MNYIINKSLIREIREFIKYIILLLRQNISFYLLKQNTNIRLKSQTYSKDQKIIERDTIHICKSSSTTRSWISYFIETEPTKLLKKEFRLSSSTYIKMIRLIFPYGFRSLNELKVSINNIDLQKYCSTQPKNYIIKLNQSQIRYSRNVNHLDININAPIKSINIKSRGSTFTYQTIRSLENQKQRTVFIVLDAIDYLTFSKSEIYNNYLSLDNHLLTKAYSPSSVTGSSLPSLLTLQPFYTHLIGDYKEWFYSHNLECIPTNLSTLAELLISKSEYREAFTSFSKTMPFYSYYRGFSLYNNRCSGNNFSPSALDLFRINLIEQQNFYHSLNSFFIFIHDIGAHPPVYPIAEGIESEYNNINSYQYSANLSLSKVYSLIQQLRKDVNYNTTNIIITSDHTESKPGFSKNEFHLTPERTCVPIYFKPSQESIFDPSTLLNLKSISPAPSIHIISSIINKLYGINIQQTEYKINNISWLSSVYSYPRRNYIFTLGFDNINQNYICIRIQSSIILKRKIELNPLEINLYIITNSIFKPYHCTATFKKQIINDLRSYILKCRKEPFYPIKQKYYNFS